MFRKPLPLARQVGRVTPCAPGPFSLRGRGAHGVTRPTLQSMQQRPPAMTKS